MDTLALEEYQHLQSVYSTAHEHEMCDRQPLRQAGMHTQTDFSQIPCSSSPAQLLDSYLSWPRRVSRRLAFVLAAVGKSWPCSLSVPPSPARVYESSNKIRDLPTRHEVLLALLSMEFTKVNSMREISGLGFSLHWNPEDLSARSPLGKPRALTHPQPSPQSQNWFSQPQLDGDFALNPAGWAIHPLW